MQIQPCRKRDGCRESGARAKIEFPISLALQISSSTLPFPRMRIWKAAAFFGKYMEDGKIGQKGEGGWSLE